MNQQTSQNPSWLLIVNPASADGRTGRQWSGNETLLRKLLPPFEAWHTTRPGQAWELAQKAVDLGFKTIAVHGGDGTFNEVANGLLNHSAAGVALAFLPSGTGADLVRTLGISHSLPEAARQACQGSIRSNRYRAGSIYGSGGPSGPTVFCQCHRCRFRRRPGPLCKQPFQKIGGKTQLFKRAPGHPVPIPK